LRWSVQLCYLALRMKTWTGLVRGAVNILAEYQRMPVCPPSSTTKRTTKRTSCGRTPQKVRQLPFTFRPWIVLWDLFILLVTFVLINEDRKSTRLNSCHVSISYDVF